MTTPRMTIGGEKAVAAAALAVGVTLVACGCSLVGDSGPRTGTPREVVAVESIDEAVQRTMAEARRAVAEHGVTVKAMQRIEAALGELAQTPGLREQTNLRELHGGGAAAAVLASDGNDDLTLILTRFQPGERTPIHDHGAWAAAYVVEGRERYIQWERVDDGSDPQRAELRVRYERILLPGDAVHWLDPPHDIHSQEAIDDVAWELLLFGRNPQKRALHYFDLETGRVTSRVPVSAGDSK